MSDILMRIGKALTFEFTPNEMTVQLRLRYKEFKFASLPSSLPLLFFYLEAVHSLFLLALPDIPLFLLILFPEHLHFSHQTFGLGLAIFGRLRCLRVRLSCLDGSKLRDTLQLSLTRLITSCMIFIDLQQVDVSEHL